MNIIFRKLSGRADIALGRGWLALLALSLSTLLSGCAFAPGMYVGNVADTHSVDVVDIDPNDPPPAGSIVPITPELLANLRSRSRTGSASDVKKLLGTASPYTIGAGDVLAITVWDHPELNPASSGMSGSAGSGAGANDGTTGTYAGGYSVSADGRVQFPYIGGLKLSGLTEDQAREALTAKLTRYFKDPQVTVRVAAYRSSRVYLDGEVGRAGFISINDIPLTLPELLARAGGLPATADRSALSVTRGGVTTRVDLTKMSEQGINPFDILLKHGDVVRVPSRDDSRIYVLGEVLRTGPLVMRNGAMTLNEALGEAGGMNQVSADPRQIFVVRTADPVNPVIFHLDARSPMLYALSEGFQLQARDVIFVDPVPLVRWNRVISLILPSAQAVVVPRTTFDAFTR